MDSDWTPPGTNANSKSFVTAYTKAYGMAPIEFPLKGTTHWSGPPMPSRTREVQPPQR